MRNRRSLQVPCSAFQLWVFTSWSIHTSLPKQPFFQENFTNTCAPQNANRQLTKQMQLNNCTGITGTTAEHCAFVFWESTSERQNAKYQWCCLMGTGVLQVCVWSQAITRQKPTHKDESIITSTSHGKYFRFLVCLARADCRQPANLTLVICAFFCVQCRGNNVNPCRDDASFTSRKQNQLATIMHVSGLVAAKKDCLCHISIENQSVLGVVVWQRVGGGDLCATSLLFFSAQWLRITLHWLDG